MTIEPNSAAQQRKKKIGLIGYGHLGQFLKMELIKSNKFSLEHVWNRSEDREEGVLSLSEMNADTLDGLDMVIEVAHSDVVANHAHTILKHADLFIGSSNALADQKTFREIQECLHMHSGRSVFVPSGALWGAKDIQKMADLGILKSLSVTMLLPPSSLRLLPLNGADSTPELSAMHKLNEESKATNNPKVLYDGPVRQICPLAPHNMNLLSVAAVAANNLGFDNTRAKIILDPALRSWHIVECEVVSENGVRTTMRRESPAQPSAQTGENSYFAFLASVEESMYKPPGFNIC